MTATGGLRRVGTLDDLWAGELVGVEIDGRPILLVRVDDTVHAYEDRCAHLGVKLSEGTLDGTVLTCHAHHWQYDVITGRGVNPQDTCLVRLPVQVHGGSIFVDLRRRP
jgi:toluene monooxygenase system ferredoxin subunit